MNIILLIAVLVLFVSVSAFVLFKFPAKKDLFIKILSISLFFVYLVRLFSFDTINQTFNLFLVDIETPKNADETWLFSPFLTVVLFILRWSGVVLVAWIFVCAIHPLHRIKALIGLYGTIVTIINVFLFNSHLIAFQNSTDVSLRSIQFIIESGLVFCVSIIYLIDSVKNIKSFKGPKEWLWFSLIIFGSFFALMPQPLLYNLFGNYGSVPKEFNAEHIVLILLPIVIIIAVYFSMYDKTKVQRDAVILFMAVASPFQYFYMRRPGFAALPLHLCNTAVMIMFVAALFKLKSFFYFSYFANVIGAIGGIMLPNYTTDIFSFGVVHFFYNHTNALIIPILAVALGVFEKPKLRYMYQAIMVFIVYFISMIFLNAWFNNYASVDYFFTYSDFLPDMLGVIELRNNYVVSFEYNGLTFTFYWLFQLVFFLVFIFLMFVSWYVYDASYQAIDQNRALRAKQKQMKIDKNLLLTALNGRSLNERMFEDYKDMIEIKNFSKRYGKSKRYAVKNFSLEVKAGEIFGFLGHNGAGKSTTIKSMVGIQSITEGEIYIDGYSIKSQPIEAKMRIGYVSDNHAVYEKLTGREYINYVADLYKIDKETRDQRLAGLLEMLQLTQAFDNEVKSYSHGMKQKLVVIASLIHEPSVWILDEPLTGLDPRSSYQIKELMRAHAQKGNIVFFSSHVIEVVEKICTKIAVITDGELTGVYDVAELKQKGVSLETLYMQDKSEVKVEA
jgi:ABC-2 type transport system ATP-binding protein